MQIIVQGLMTHYESYGSGKQVLILHGWADTGRNWRAIARRLSRTYEVIVPDLPGFGGTEAPKSVWGLEDYAKFVGSFIAKAGFVPYAIVGHSNGGAIAIRGVSSDMLHPTKLVLLASAGIRDEAHGRKNAWRLLAKAGKIAATPLPSSARNRLRSRLYRAAGSDMLIAEHLQETFKRVVSDDVRNDTRRVTMPTLLLYGENDSSTPPRFGEMLSRPMADATFRTIQGAGHLIQIDEPDSVVRFMEEFLE